MSRRTVRRDPVDDALHTQLVEEAIDRYVDWREESAAVGEAYGQWVSAPEEEAALSFAAYGAALDREELAATVYGGVVDRLERMFGAELELAAGPRR